jgi:hypothetical protein
VATARLGVVVAVALVDTTGLLAGRGETTALAVLWGEVKGLASPNEISRTKGMYSPSETNLVDGLADPVDAGVTADSLVLGVDQDNLEVLVSRVLVDPVGVQDAQVGATATDTLLSGGTEGTLVLELVHTLVGGLACRSRQKKTKLNQNQRPSSPRVPNLFTPRGCFQNCIP